MLCFFSVAEAHGLIYPRHSGENFSFACYQELIDVHDKKADKSVSVICNLINTDL